MPHTAEAICDNCGQHLASAGPDSALQVLAYDRTKAQLVQMLFCWDTPDRCGQRALQALREVLGTGKLGPFNEIPQTPKVPPVDRSAPPTVDTWTQSEDYHQGTRRPEPSRPEAAPLAPLGEGDRMLPPVDQGQPRG